MKARTAFVITLVVGLAVGVSLAGPEYIGAAK